MVVRGKEFWQEKFASFKEAHSRSTVAKTVENKWRQPVHVCGEFGTQRGDVNET